MDDGTGLFKAGPRAAVWLPYVILIGGMLATGGSAFVVWKAAEARDRQDFLHATEIELQAIHDQFGTYTALLRGGAGLFAASNDAVSLRSFRTYVERIDLECRYPGFLGIGFTRILPASDQEQLAAEMRAQGVADFHVHPATGNPVISPVLFAEPPNARNQAAIGFDVMSDPNRREMVERARDSGRAIASARLQLVQEIDGNKQAGFLVATPVYAGGAVPSSLDARRAAFRGFVFGAFRADDLFSSIVATRAEDDAALTVYDGAPSEATLLHRSAPRDTAVDSAKHRRTTTLEIGGRAWTVLFASRTPKERNSAKADAWFVGGGGLLATALLSLAALRQRRTQRKVQQLNASLERRVEERTRELRFANNRLREAGEERARAEDQLRQSQKMEAVGQLTGGVAHDFNNLLTIIRSSVDLLQRPGLPEERRHRYLQAVSDTVDRAAKLTGQLLAFARRQTLKPEWFDVGARVRAVADMLDTVTGARVRVLTAVPVMPCFVQADPSQFETALVNMAVNARDAMNGEGTLTLSVVRQPMPAIRGHAGATGSFVAVSLHDTGSGIPPDQLGHIFEPFYTTKGIGKGTGLGLSQVFGFAKQSGGDIDVTSTPGEGTTFTLYLPEVAAGAVTGTDACIDRNEPAPTGGGQRVLVVEDNVEVGRFATQILEDLGYLTELAVNAEAALERLAHDGAGFDVVFSDVVMPGMGGIELAKALRHKLPTLPVVLASGYSHVLAQEGVGDFTLLNKPYSAEQLARVLRDKVGQAQQGRARLRTRDRQ